MEKMKISRIVLSVIVVLGFGIGESLAQSPDFDSLVIEKIVEDSVASWKETRTYEESDRMLSETRTLDSVDYRRALIAQGEYLVEERKRTHAGYRNLGKITKQRNQISGLLEDLTGESLLDIKAEDNKFRVEKSTWRVIWPDKSQKDFEHVGDNFRVKHDATGEFFNIKIWGPGSFRATGGIFSSQFRDFYAFKEVYTGRGRYRVSYGDEDGLGFIIVQIQ